MKLCDAADDHAAVVLLVHPDGQRILAISRDQDVDDWGLPGGGSEPQDRDVEDTARRELLEETGVKAGELVPIHRHRSDLYCTTTFLARSVDRWPQVLQSDPFEGYVEWVEPHVLVAPTSRHRKATAELFDHLGVCLGGQRRTRLAACASFP